MPPRRRLNPCSYLPRRLQIVVSLTISVLFCILFLGSSSSTDQYLNSIPYGPQLEEGAHHLVEHFPKAPSVKAPAWLNPFRAPAHSPPPEQANSSAGDAKWFADFKWRNPFSSSVTLDEERTVLPPLRERVPVYTYFDAADRRKDERSKKAEQELLQTWRRAWWAKGFKPVVLGSSEAVHNPLYSRVMDLKLKDDFQQEMMKWLAWGYMGTGVMVHWLTVPMGKQSDPLLSYLRRGEYPTLTRYPGLESALFAGPKEEIDRAIQVACGSKNLDVAKSVADVVPPEMIKVDPEHSGIASYSVPTLKAKYPVIGEKFDADSTFPDGLEMLDELINSHLHITWQNSFPKGMQILKTEPKHTTSLIEPAIDLARNLSQCSQSPIPASCPPNIPKCVPCVSSQPMLITTPPIFRNKSDIFSIATVPHPYTLQSLIHKRDYIDVRFIRRDTQRDVWILGATKEFLGTGISSYARLTSLKDAIASDFGQWRSLWLTAENPPQIEDSKDLEDLDWSFGFKIPREGLKSGKSETPVPGPERRPPPPKQEFDGPVPTDAELQTQRDLLEKAKMAVARGEVSKINPQTSKKAPARSPYQVTREAIEAWNLADTESWKFVRAFNARKRYERRKWEEEEEAFLGKGQLDRWKDFVVGDHT